jgi:protease-4
MTPAEIETLAQGRVWTGREAAQSGLVDGLGGLDEAVRLARQRARIPAGQSLQIVVLPETKGFLETLLERQEPGVYVRALGTQAAALVRFAKALESGGPTARLPFDLAIR